MTTTQSILDDLLKHSPWVDREKTVDTVKAGDPDRPVRRAGVCWYASIETLHAAHASGCELIVMHEPLYWDHLDRPGGWRERAPGDARRQFLEETGLVVARVHDVWDQWPVDGIRDRWAAFLGFEQAEYLSETDAGHRYHGVYRVPEQRLDALAQHIADRVRPLGEDGVQVMGDPARRVSRPALGVGCIGPDADTVARGADVAVVCFDGAPYWAVRERLFEQGAAVITVEHGTCEMPGIEGLCEHLAARHPEIHWQLFAEHPRTWTVRGR